MKHRGTILFFAGFAGMSFLGWFAFPRVLYRSAAQPVQFSHRLHTGDKGGMKCEDCHAVLADGSFSGIPKLEKCAGCHAAALGNTDAEKRMIKDYIEPNREIPWLVYSRQPENVHFSHVFHVKLAQLPCERCHSGDGTSDTPRPYQEDRVSGYSRDIWGASMSRLVRRDRPGMKMDDCMDCHERQGAADSCLTCHK
jgi:hypothetical protein